MDRIYVVFSADQITAKLQEYIDKGMFAEANGLSYKLDGFMEMIKSFIQRSGGHLYLDLPQRQILDIPATVADQIPNLIESYQTDFGNKLAVGIGMNLYEAGHAAERSVRTGAIELYDPQHSEEEDAFALTKDVPLDSPADPSDSFLELPPNLFDPTKPKTETEVDQSTAAKPPTLEESVQIAATAVQMVLDSVGFQPPPPPQPPQQMQPGQEPGQPPQQSEEEQGEPLAQADFEPTNILEALEQQPTELDPKQKEHEEAKAGVDQFSERVGMLLGSVKKQLPKIMKLQSKNPEAFAQAMKLMHKLIDLAKLRDKTEKSEQSYSDELVDQLNGALQKKMTFPIGTRKGRRIKVLVGGKASWRSAASGQVRDQVGNPISVKSANKQADGK